MLEFPPGLVDPGRFTAIPAPVPRPPCPEPALDPTKMLALAAEHVMRPAPARADAQSLLEELERLGPLQGWSLLQAVTLGFTAFPRDEGPRTEAAARTATGWQPIGASRYPHPDGVPQGWCPSAARLLAGLAADLVTPEDLVASLDVVESELAALADVTEFAGIHWQGWAATWRALCGGAIKLEPVDVRRWFGLVRWVHERVHPGQSGLDLWPPALAARRVGACTLEDLWWVVARAPGLVGRLSRPSDEGRPSPAADAFSELQASSGPILEWLVDTEIERGKPEAATTAHARCVESITGTDRIARLLARMATNREQFVAVPGKNTRNHVLTRLARVSEPSPGDTAGDLRRSLEHEGVSEDGLLQLVMVTPRWADLAEELLGWPGLSDAVCWLHAHCDPDTSFSHRAPPRWEPLLEQRTTVALAEIRRHRVIDRDLFERVVAHLGPARWDALARYAKVASQNKSHLRALSAADALLGRLQSGPGLDIDIEALVPLPTEPAERQDELSRRLGRIRAVDPDRTGRPKKGTRDLFTNAMRDLARTAGHQDARQLMWAVEAAAQREPGRASATPKQQRAGEQQAAHDLEEAMIAGYRLDRSLREVVRNHRYLWPMVGALLMVDAAGVLGCLSAEDELVGLDGAARPVEDWAEVVHPVGIDGSAATKWLEHLGPQPIKQLAREVFRPAGAELASDATSVWKGMPVKPFRAIAVAQSRGWVLAEPGVRLEKRFSRGPVDAWIRFEGARVLPHERAARMIDTIGFSRGGGITIAEVDPVVYSEVVRDASLFANVGHFRAGEAASPH